ncbi:MFS general substrate transporter [Aaosphaeria arxii CBS 175.79]|uniref:MFS general substrate transporter n=1 Tax=Aaosphaeria arxii CBS 175.79 TaxID=1450172 RepID=A0A6A5XAX8_9PLEO|nr:MFS general substrate transporter [Aaosphaeria arxii CBS 175.79]KAF2010059.1 MFS general substrate transporter [Aaosphaeria arxii CBS 175.79]
MSTAGGIHGFFDIQHSTSQPVASPAATLQKSKGHARQAPSNIELDEYTFGKKYNGPLRSGPPTPGEAPSAAESVMENTLPQTPNELEMSRPPSPKMEEAANLMQCWNDPPKNKWRVLSCCLIYFGNGINDSATGALIPYMEHHYAKGHAIMSLIFVGQALGFVTAAFFNNLLLSKIGRAKMLMTAELILILSYIVLVCTPPFPAVVIAFFLLGYGMAMTLALNNVFCSNLQPTTVVLGAAHGSYGIGGIFAPILATLMVSNGIVWSRFYFVPFAIAIVAMPFAGWAFWDYQEETPQTLITALERTASRQMAGEEAVSKLHDLKVALKSRVTIFGALFIFAYQGAEVSISGWVISFLINYRDGDPSSVGYVTAGFWGGITLGRFVLTHLAPRIGERRFVILLILGTTAFQLLAWLVPNVITNAVAVSILGLLLGPVYPCASTIFARLMPRSTQTTAIGFIAGAGSSGGAVAPFTTGILAQAVGTWVLHPVCIGLYVCMLGCWLGMPRIRKRTE